MNDVDFAVGDVLHGIDVAHQVGLGPIKINMVVKGGMNDQEIVPMARHFKDTPYILRFIEYMDVGASNGWNMGEVIPSAEVVRRISAEMPLDAGRRQLHRRNRGALALCRRRRRSRHDLQRHPVVLQGLHARAPVDRRASSTPACSPPAATTCAPCCAQGAATPRFPAPSHSCGARAPTATPTRAPSTPPASNAARNGSKCPTSADNTACRKMNRSAH